MTQPAPPPEAALIGLVREASRTKIPALAKIAGISVARWSQVENGYEVRGGVTKRVDAPAGTLAHMAAALGISPDRLASEGQRPDAAIILREIHRRGGIGRPHFPDDPQLEDVAARLWLAGRNSDGTDMVSWDDDVRRGYIVAAQRVREEALRRAGKRNGGSDRAAS